MGEIVPMASSLENYRSKYIYAMHFLKVLTGCQGRFLTAAFSTRLTEINIRNCVVFIVNLDFNFVSDPSCLKDGRF